MIAFVANDAFAAEPRPVVAVFPIEDAAGRLDQKSLLQLTDYYSATIAASGRYTTVPRKDLEAALKEKKADSYKTCIDQACQIEIGREVAAQKVIQTQIVKLGDRCGVTSTIYDLRANASEKAAVGKGGCTENDLVATLEKVAQDLLGSGGPPLAPPPLVVAPPPAPPPPASAAGPTFTLRVEAEPSDAEIMVDGKMIGKGSISADLEPGSAHHLSVRLEGFVSHEEDVSLTEDARRRISLSMTAQARAEKSEVFGFSLAYYQTPTGNNGFGLWLQAPVLRMGGIAWTVAEVFLGFHRTVHPHEDQSLSDGEDRDPDTGLGLTDAAATLFLLSTRVGYRFILDDAGANVIEVSLGPALHVNASFSGRGPSYTGLSLQPAIRYLRVPEGGFGVGFGLRASIPMHHSCEFSLEAGAIDYVGCARDNPIMFQAEVPFGVY